ncbi:sugar-binding transcriptional regulator [Anaerobiospirillum succiniciproducens]|uniref:sugar-binding transcriptional regulator n=1 Tax=Anaerobiospirillum succiniciproducens TaxID=13335 RepID=UPI003F88C867
MDKAKVEQYIQIAQRYYEQNQTQDQIAQDMGLSRPSVSRILQYCKDKNIVQVKVVNPFVNFEDSERLLEQKYKLRKVLIAKSPSDNDMVIMQSISAKAASYLNDSVCNSDVIGVCWGRTLYTIAKLLTPRMVKGVKVVQLKGGVSYSLYNTHAKEILDTFTQKFNALGYYLPLPTFFSDLKTKQIVEKDPFVNDILELGRTANIAIFTVGAFNADSVIFNLSNISARQRRILEREAVGDIVSRLINSSGKICSKELDERTNGINLDELKAKSQRILVAGGSDKWPAIKAALAGGYANILITDQFTAHFLL